MPQKQTRKSVSVRGEVYRQLRCLCDKHGVSMSHVVEQLVECLLSLRDGKETENLEDAEFTQAAEKTEKKFSWTTAATPAEKKPIRGGGVHEL